MIKVKNFGFTLVELLVVMAIIAVLTLVAVANFRNVQIKARDGQRKSDLGQVQRALEIYLFDYGSYPLSSNGSIRVGAVTLSWKTPVTAGSVFIDSKGTLYMKEVVGDPKANPSYPNYCYSSDGVSYKIYARLENTDDPKIGTYTCAGENYNYGVSSPNVNP